LEVYLKTYYAADVEVYGDTYFVNTETGEGIDKVLKKIDPLLCGQASRSYLPGYTFEDLKQELSIIAIDGINAYDPSRGVKLSTFLQTHIKHKFISKMRSENKMSNDAFGLYDDKGEGGGKIRGIREELNFSQCTPVNNENELIPFENSVGGDDGIYENNVASYDSINFKLSLNKFLEKTDPKTAKIIKLVSFKGCTIKDAARIVGLSDWAASTRLKNLSKKRVILDIFDKLD
jgi:RNA polymerase sigma factor (sigma-70 family)